MLKPRKSARQQYQACRVITVIFVVFLIFIILSVIFAAIDTIQVFSQFSHSDESVEGTISYTSNASITSHEYYKLDYSDVYKTASPQLIATELVSSLYDNPFTEIPADAAKAESIREAFYHAYQSYRKLCWAFDELKPISKSCKNTLHAGLTIVDSITTLYIMNFTEDYEEARNFIANDFHPSGKWSVFEFVIRFIGGFISIYQMTHDQLYLDKAIECADAIFPVFNQETGMYSSSFKLSTNSKGKLVATQLSSWKMNLAEVGTYQLEFLTLTALTGDKKYMDLALKLYKRLWKDNPNYTILVDPTENQRQTNRLIDGQRHLGGAADSYYEYIIKTYLLTNGVSPRILKQHLMIMKDIKKDLLFTTDKLKLIGIGVWEQGKLRKIVEHLATFVPGMIAIGTVKNNDKKDEDMQLAKKIVDTLSYVKNTTKSKLMPEQVEFDSNEQPDQEYKIRIDEYLLRPESVESIFYLYRFTGEKVYRELAWKFFLGINQSCRVENGFVSVKNLNGRLNSIDIMDSWFLAETLNYLYLTFTDTRLISPADWVFNTESHPLRRWPNDISQKYKKDLQLNDC